MHILTLVDLQNTFLDSLDEMDGGIALHDLIDNVCKVVTLFKKKNYPIIALHYQLEHGFELHIPEDKRDWESLYLTHHRIRDAIGDYDKFHVKWKCRDDGSVQVKNVMKQHNYKGQIYLAGVNGCACVKSTWRGLCKVGKNRYSTVAISEATRNVFDDDPVEQFIPSVVKMDNLEHMLT